MDGDLACGKGDIGTRNEEYVRSPPDQGYRHEVSVSRERRKFPHVRCFQLSACHAKCPGDVSRRPFRDPCDYLIFHHPLPCFPHTLPTRNTRKKEQFLPLLPACGAALPAMKYSTSLSARAAHKPFESFPPIWDAWIGHERRRCRCRIDLNTSTMECRP